MIRIRFHGRGGHGVKTASRIVGTAGFLAGYQCQDSPVYGAERRGAAVTAFTRIDNEPILERGVIAHPDLIVLADETLLNDPTAGVLAGQDSASAIFINSQSTEPLIAEHGISARVVSHDVTRRTMDVLGSAVALSAGLGAAAARATGLIDKHTLVEALHEEFGHLRLADDTIAKNVQIAVAVFDAVPVLEFDRQTIRDPEAAATRGEVPVLESVGAIADVKYDGPISGAPSVFNAGNAELRQTGAWRVERPEIDLDACTRCSLCYVMCPDAAMVLTPEGFPIVDLDHCKGCMLCRELCPVDAISTVKETQAW